MVADNPPLCNDSPAGKERKAAWVAKHGEVTEVSRPVWIAQHGEPTIVSQIRVHNRRMREKRRAARRTAATPARLP